jgi:hypothetical protein
LLCVAQRVLPKLCRVWPPWLVPPDPLSGLAVAGPLEPDPLVELSPAVAAPVVPVLPDWVLPVVSAFPDLAVEPEFDVVLTAPD